MKCTLKASPYMYIFKRSALESADHSFHKACSTGDTTVGM